MEKLAKFWLIFAIIGVSATFLNPYVGFFGLFNIIELFFMLFLFFYINSLVKVKELNKDGENKIFKATIKPLGIVAYILPVIFFLLNIFVGLGSFILAYSQHQVMAPYQVWSNPDQMSVVCLIVAMIFNIVLLISFIGKAKIIRRMTKCL
ncbi:hypothetical protein K2F43_08445 [Clostridium estertheticum]|uniref:hypothetical protein n=1 Tax=Clostridium estertheticum TaxID=238834 RepID=UPI001C6EB9B7|nr:hypothetical protein [Clostridium estertheticum]MBW9171233.1 hypothetical protein [Clostridium estertheticum]WLC73911.1 hypothetical protein KTC99_14095 [Clostridium estertheticum]